MMMMLMIVLPNVSLVVSSSRGCFEKTEKKTPPLSGGALIRADRESFMRTFLSFFPFLSPKKRHFFLEKTNHIKIRERRRRRRSFCRRLLRRKAKSVIHVWSEDASAEETERG
jgi:hypothetical protein